MTAGDWKHRRSSFGDGYLQDQLCCHLKKEKEAGGKEEVDAKKRGLLGALLFMSPIFFLAAQRG